MAQRQQKSASIDALPAELVDWVLKAVTADSPQTSKDIARVNRAFRDAVRRCSQTLVLRKLKKGKKKPPEPDVACIALAEELSLRPVLCNLVVDRGAEPCLLPALGSIQWTSVKVVVEGEALERFWHILRTSKDTLKRLDVDPGRHYPYHLAGSVLNMAQWFPGLESLTLNGGKAGAGSSVDDLCRVQGTTDLGVESSCLGKLDIVSFKFTDWSEAIYRSLPLHLPSLTSFRFQCTTRKSMVFSPKTTALQSAFVRIQCLNLDVYHLSVPNSMLENIANNCPRLQHLVIHTIPPSRIDWGGPCRDSDHSTEVFSRVLDKCPDLKRFVLSEARMMFPKHFAWVLNERSLLPTNCIGDLKSIEMALHNNIAISGSDHSVEENIVGQGTKILTFYLIAPMSGPRWDRRGNPALIKERMIGHPATIQSWLQEFC